MSSLQLIASSATPEPLPSVLRPAKKLKVANASEEPAPKEQACASSTGMAWQLLDLTLESTQGYCLPGTACMLHAGPQYGRSVEALKGVCKAASITIPPNVYVKVDTAQDVEDRLLALLAKHNLSRAPTPRDIEAVRKTLQKQRDLDGACTCWHEHSWFRHAVPILIEIKTGVTSLPRQELTAATSCQEGAAGGSTSPYSMLLLLQIPAR